MVRAINRLATVGLRYKALVKERGIASKVLDDFLTDQFSENKTKVNTFLREGNTPSKIVRHILIVFAKEYLGIELPESWFDVEWHPSAPIDVFLSKNRHYDSVIQQACGRYLHISAKASQSKDAVSGQMWRVGRLMIEDNDEFFGFKMGSEQAEEVGDNPYCGFVVCHSDTLFLTGFDTKHHEKVISLILRKAPTALDPEGVRFCGVQVGTLPMSNMPNGRAIAKCLVIISEHTWTTTWNCGTLMPDSVSNWLKVGGVPLIADLVTQRLDEEA